MTTGAAVVAHLRSRGVPVGERAAITIRALVDNAPAYLRASALLVAEGIHPNTARLRMQKASLPSPSRFHQLGRALHAVVALQGQRHARVEDVARSLGYMDHSALVHLFRRQFGRTPSLVRLYARRGPEWLVDAWLVDAWLERRP